jgi:aminoglycoside 3-N-acetyltransferase I
MSIAQIRRLMPSDAKLALSMFAVMARAFEEPFESPGADYVQRLLSRADFWALAALIGEHPVGGLTAFTLPLTRAPEDELFIYDIAVAPEHQRQGIGRRLVQSVRDLAAQRGITTTWVPAENVDDHALDFYRSIGSVPNPVTIFTFGE